MPNIIPYDVTAALQYSEEFALKRNPKFFDFTNYGGNCTNFISQCVYAGAKVMNYKKTFGWYYISSYDRAPAWTSVQYFYNFMTTNKTRGPFAIPVPMENLVIGDIIQLKNPNNVYYHNLMVAVINGEPTPENILINANDFDALHRPLDTYNYTGYRCLHIQGVYV